MITNNTEHFVLDPVSENEVLIIIENFKDSSAGWDELKQLIMKNIKESIKTPLTHICNKSFSNGLFPSELKKQMWYQYSNQGMKWCFQIIGLCLSYHYFQIIRTTNV